MSAITKGGRRSSSKKLLDELSADLFIRLKERARSHHRVEDYDPMHELLDIALTRTTPPDLKARINMHMSRFFYAERQVVEVHNETPASPQASPEEVADAILGRLERAARERKVAEAREVHAPKALVNGNGRG